MLDVVFRTEFGGEFLEGSGAVFRNVRECATGAWQEPEEHQPYYAGLDLARVSDYSVLAILNKQREVVFVDRFTRLDWSLQINRIKAATDRFNHAQIYVDSTGVGEPIFESIRAAGCNVWQYGFTQKTKAALIDNLSLLLEQRKIVLLRPDLWPEGIDELESFEYSIAENGSVRTSAPSGTHDDCVIALALAAWHLRPRPNVSMPICGPIIIYADGSRSAYPWE